MSTGPVTILVAEDDPFVRETVVPELEHSGYAVVETENGEAALAFLQAGHRVDLLFTDIRMPGVDGWDLADEARALRPGLPVIYATGYSEKDGRHVPGSIMLTKPYRSKDVVRAAMKLGVWPQRQNRP